MKLVENITRLNTAEFGETDWYSSEKNITTLVRSPNYIIMTVRVGNEFAGYILCAFRKNYVEGLRSAVVEKYRGRKLGQRLFKKVFKLAEKLGMPYWTYTSYDNLESINSHVRAGMRIKHIYTDDQSTWVELQYTP